MSRANDIEYLKYITRSPRTIQPDSLQLHPKSLKLEELKDSLTISDGVYSMKIYFIGNKSSHTNDYLVYYFSEEKLLNENDLVYITKKDTTRKASFRETGLYNAVKELKLEIKTVVQSWPVTEFEVKTIFPFKELEKIMQ